MAQKSWLFPEQFNSVMLVVACLKGSYLEGFLMYIFFLCVRDTCTLSGAKDVGELAQEDFLHNYPWVCISYFDFHLRL